MSLPLFRFATGALRSCVFALYFNCLLTIHSSNVPVHGVPTFKNNLSGDNLHAALVLPSIIPPPWYWRCWAALSIVPVIWYSNTFVLDWRNSSSYKLLSACRNFIRSAARGFKENSSYAALVSLWPDVESVAESGALRCTPDLRWFWQPARTSSVG